MHYPEIVTQIHNEFKSAGEKLLKQAQATTDNIQKGKRLLSAGFTATKEAAEAKEFLGLSEQASIIMKYMVEYPLNKFIDETTVAAICNKYNLAKAPISRYKGFVPEKKLADIESFKVNKTDLPANGIRVTECWGIGLASILTKKVNARRVHKILGMQQIPSDSKLWRFRNCLITPKGNVWCDEMEVINKSEMCICAPAKDFDLKGLVKNKKSFFSTQKMTFPDPVVLQPVNGGYLIVTAWGDEASDENVVNSINN